MVDGSRLVLAYSIRSGLLPDAAIRAFISPHLLTKAAAFDSDAMLANTFYVLSPSTSRRFPPYYTVPDCNYVTGCVARRGRQQNGKTVSNPEPTRAFHEQRKTC